MLANVPFLYLDFGPYDALHELSVMVQFCSLFANFVFLMRLACRSAQSHWRDSHVWRRHHGLPCVGPPFHEVAVQHIPVSRTDRRGPVLIMAACGQLNLPR